MLQLEGMDLEYTQKELFSFIVNTASGKARYEELLKRIISHER